MDKERWNIRIDCDKMEKIIKCNILVQYKVYFFKKTSSSIKQSIVFFYEWLLFKNMN